MAKAVLTDFMPILPIVHKQKIYKCMFQILHKNPLHKLLPLQMVRYNMVLYT